MDDTGTDAQSVAARMIDLAARQRSELTSERLRQEKAQAAAAGHYRGGRRPFGYDSDGVSIIATEADMIASATTQVLSGRSLSAIAKEWAATDVRTSTGLTWNYARVKRVLCRPRNAGLICTGTFEDGDLVIVGRAVWPAIVSADDFHALLALLGDPTRRKGSDHANIKHLGSGIYTCSRCGGPMRVGPVLGVPTYSCLALAHLAVKAAPTDAMVRSAVAELLSQRSVIDAMTADTSSLVVQHRAERGRLTARLEATRADYDNDLIDGARYQAKTTKIVAELEQVEASIAGGLQAAAPDPGAAFLAAPLDVQRAVLRQVLRVQVLSARRRGKPWTPDRLVLTPVGHDEEAAS